MLPVISLIGRPNVGKSTLFNRLTRSRNAIVSDYPGLTRDRQYGFAELDAQAYIVIDTGGIAGQEIGVDELMAEQTLHAVKESDVVIIMTDGRSGLTSADQYVVDLVRKKGKKIILVVNKTEGLDLNSFIGEFYELGLGDPIAISAAHGDFVSDLMYEVFSDLEQEIAINPELSDKQESLRIAVIGRPNVGKSTLINRLIGEDRLVVFDQPGTTRDSVEVPFSVDGNNYILEDTAGIRRKSRVRQSVEKFSVIKSLRAIDKSNVVIAVLDGREGITEQDISLIGLAVVRGRSLVVTINKWDGLTRSEKNKIYSDIDRRLPFLEFAEKKMISALYGSGVKELLPAASSAYEAAMKEMSATILTRELEAAVEAHQPPLVRGRRIKVRYAHQGGRNPPVIVIHGKQTERLPDSYRRYLINRFRKRFKLTGTPIRLSFKTDNNPYKGKRNKLTPRQQRRRKRLMRKVKK